MSNQPSSTRAQKLFLQAFRDNPAGPPPSQWPSPSTLRRWLLGEKFRTALNQYRDTMRFQADFHIAAAATVAAKSIHTTVAAPAPADPAQPQPDLTKQLKSLTDLLHLSHIRQRFTAQPQTNQDEEASEENSPCNTPRPGITWYDQPHIIANIFCDENKSRLKAYMLLLTMRGVKGFEPFLAAYPNELKSALENAAKREAKKLQLSNASPPGSTETPAQSSPSP